MIKPLFKLLLGVAILIFALIIGPLIGIWSLNTLFPVLAIPYTWQTWLAFLFLLGSLTGLRARFKR
jgi:hypothetical protein